MKILVLGGTGAMGVHLVEILSKRNDNQVIVSSRRKLVGKDNIFYVQGNAHDLNFLYQLLKDKFDVIIDFMNYRTEEFKERYQKLLSSSGQYVFLSSSRVYANSERPITEDSPRLLDVVQDQKYLSTDEYALAKARQENLLRDSEYTNWTIIRPYITYSENRLQLGVLEKEAWLYRALHGHTIVFSKDISDHSTTLTYGLDVARAIITLIGREEAKGEVFHITTSNSIAWKEVLDIYLDVLEVKLKVRPNVIMTDLSLNLQSDRAKYQVLYDRHFNRCFDNSKINRFIDISTFRNPKEGLYACLTHFCESPIFNWINWGQEAKFDRLAGELSSIMRIPSIKQKVKYSLYRYIIK